MKDLSVKELKFIEKFIECDSYAKAAVHAGYSQNGAAGNLTATIPTLNQSTTGNAATATSNANGYSLTRDSSASISLAISNSYNGCYRARMGNMVIVFIDVTLSTTIAAGANPIIANNIGLQPFRETIGCVQGNSNYVLAASIDTSGVIRARNNLTSAIPSGTTLRGQIVFLI